MIFHIAVYKFHQLFCCKRVQKWFLYPHGNLLSRYSMPLENTGCRFNGIAQEQAGGDKLYRSFGVYVLERGMARSVAADFYITQTPYFPLLHAGDMHPQLFIEAEDSAEVDILRYRACFA